MFVDQLARHFGHVFRMYTEFGAVGLDLQLFIFGLLVLCIIDVAELVHAQQDVLLARLGAFRVGDRIVGRRRLRQPGQHGRLGHADVLQFFAEINLGRRREAVGALSQIDLVHVDLEDLILAQVFLDFPGQQDFVNLALEGLLAGQEEIARHLLGDGRGPLFGAAGQIVQRGARDAEVVDAAVLIKAVVFDGQYSLLHDIRDFLETHHGAPLFAEFSDQHPVRRENPQRHLGPVIGQRIDRRQVRIRHRQRKTDDQCADHRQSGEQAQQPKQ